MNEEEFLRLVIQFFNQQYDTPEEEIADEKAIIIAYEKKDKPKLPMIDKVVDVTNIKPNQLITHIENASNVKIGKFLLKIQRRKFKELPDIIIYETIKEGLISKVDIFKDSRFKQTDWFIYFNSFKIGSNVPEDKIINIVRWLQAITKLSAFI